MSRRKDSELLVISLYEIDRELEDREPSLPKDTKPAPNEYRGFSDVFSKEALDKLPPVPFVRLPNRTRKAGL